MKAPDTKTMRSSQIHHFSGNDLAEGNVLSGDLYDKADTDKGRTGILWRVLSVHAMIAVMCLTCVALSATSSEALHNASCQSGLDKTRATTDDATTAMGDVASRSLSRVSLELIMYTTVGVRGMTELMLQGTVQDAMNLRAILTHSFRDIPKNSTEFMSAVSPRLWSMFQSLHENTSTTAIGVFSGKKAFATYYSGIFDASNPRFQGTRPMGLMALTEGRQMFGASDPYKGELILDDPTIPFFPVRHQVERLSGVREARAGAVPVGSVIFPKIESIGDFVGYAAAMKIPHDYGQVEGILYMSVQKVEDLLRSLAAKAKDVDGNAVLRLYTVCAASRMARHMRALGLPGWQDYEQEGYLTGVSSGSAVQAVQGYNLLALPATVYRPLHATNATDNVIRGVARAVNGSYADFNDRSTILEVDVNGTVETFFVSVLKVSLPEQQIDWWVVTVLDTASVLGEVRELELTVRGQIRERKQSVADDITSRQSDTRLIILSIAAGLVLVSILLSYRIVRPINVMQQNMAMVANMELDGVEAGGGSKLYEIYCMQRDFRKMVENLTEFRAYVPSAVLESSGFSGAGGKDVVKPPTGNVAIVFTDIKGSTELWKSSAGDMNAAMEIHNEVMREACLDHEGYEVKTIGDAFMVSFHCQYMASKFALQVQTKLALRKWPPALELPEAGMVVRIGINYGPTIAEENPVTGRVDYRGSTVNLASRVEAKAKGGTICLTSDMYTAIKPDLAALGNPAIHNHGLHDIKGLGNGHQLYLMVPSHLSKRFSEDTADTTAGRGRLQSHVVYAMQSSNSDDTGSVMSELYDAVRSKRTGLQLQRMNVTVAVCRLQEVKHDSTLFDNCNIMVRSALEAANATDGVIGNVTGRTLTVVWNASKKCAMHSTAALNFVSEMKKLQGIMQVGLATGTMLHGNVGTKTSRFATAFGTPLEAAEAMTDHASMFGVYCLYADCTIDRRLQADVTVRSCLRLVDAWQVPHRRRTMHIYDVDLPSLAQALQGWDAGRAQISSECIDLEHHTDVVAEALQGRASELHALVETRPDDLVLQHTRALIDEFSPTEGYRCTARFVHYECGGAATQCSAAGMSDIHKSWATSASPVINTAVCDIQAEQGCS